MEKPQRAKIDFKKRCDSAAGEFYRAGIKYIAALDAWVEEQKSLSVPDKDLKSARQRIRVVETYLHRLFPDEFADTSSAAE
jgi:hypothetical protein